MRVTVTLVEVAPGRWVWVCFCGRVSDQEDHVEVAEIGGAAHLADHRERELCLA